LAKHAWLKRGITSCHGKEKPGGWSRNCVKVTSRVARTTKNITKTLRSITLLPKAEQQQCDHKHMQSYVFSDAGAKSISTLPM
jgi:hypothetical protein